MVFEQFDALGNDIAESMRLVTMRLKIEACLWASRHDSSAMLVITN